MTTSSAHQFRPAGDDDIPAVVAIIREAYAPVAEMVGVTEEAVPRFAAYTTVESLTAYIDKFGVRMFLLCAGGPVGCGGYSPDRDGEPKAWLNRIAVPPEQQGRGYGKAIVEFLEDELRRQGFDLVRLRYCTVNERLRAFYEVLGYQAVETRLSKSWQIDITYMEKPLEAPE